MTYFIGHHYLVEDKLHAMPLTTTALMNALEGVTYITDPDGIITACGEPGWKRALAASGSKARLDPQQVIGRSLFDCITGEAVRDSYRVHMERAADPRRHARVFLYRCDTPDLIRVMRMAITAVRDPDGTLTGFLFQTVVVQITERVPVALFTFPAATEDTASWPFLGMCSYCQNVRFPARSKEGEGEWLDAIDYYRRGGDNAVVISHGVCPTCFATVVQDNLRNSLGQADLT